MELTSRQSSENNEINSLKLAIFKALKKSNSTTNCKLGYLKTMTVDLPLSLPTFDNCFREKIRKLQQYQPPTVKCHVSINDLKLVSGNNWHIYNHPDSCIRQRILGLIQINYREKQIAMTTSNFNRYIFLSLQQY